MYSAILRGRVAERALPRQGAATQAQPNQGRFSERKSRELEDRADETSEAVFGVFGDVLERARRQHLTMPELVRRMPIASWTRTSATRNEKNGARR